jgi:hypothetical protein
MTVLMVVFLYSIAKGLVQMQKKKEQDKIFKDHRETKESLYKDLNAE